jgi:diguanylate cyclase (GGDEF)-like protein
MTLIGTPMHLNTVNLRRAIFAVMAGIIAFRIAGLIHAGEDTPLETGSDIVIDVVATGLVLWRATVTPRERLAWSMIGLNLVALTIADLGYAFVSHDAPNWTDAMYMLTYVFAAAGMVLLLRDRRVGASCDVLIDGLIGGLAFSAVAAALLYGPLIDHASGDSISMAVGVAVAYPVLDLATLCLVVVAIGSAGWRLDRTWALLGAGFVINAIADGVYSYSGINGEWKAGGWIAFLWPLAVTLMAGAAWQPRSTRVHEADGLISIAVPTMASLIALGVMIAGAAGVVSIGGVVVALAAATLLLAGVRSVLTFRENIALLQSSRTEALTDNLSLLGNRRALMEELERRLDDEHDEQDEPQRSTLVYFDLDGFKGYNDAFGHSAGDALLARLAKRLRTATLPTGLAYRPGGDEFCVIFDEELSRDDFRVSAALGALAEQGDGFDIAASFGLVHIPSEADTPTLAMNIVDERMYDDKGDRRRSARSQARDLLLQLLHEREPELEQHVSDVALHTVATGRRMGISGEALDELARGAELHDLGKVSIPDSILHKPGPLDDNEWRLMHQHTIVGERILAAVPSLQPVAKLVRASHERWDGGGYPDGLAAAEIPLGARIIAACDAFDAMVSKRPYANAVSVEVAIEELERCAGGQFDPEVVAACVAVVHSGELEAERELNQADRA